MNWWLEHLTPDQEVKARALNAVIVSIVLLGSMTLKHVSTQTHYEKYVLVSLAALNNFFLEVLFKNTTQYPYSEGL